jgi:hypothetical protein
MATNSNLDSLEREAAEARARLAATLDRLSSPETAAAVKQELTDYAQGLKNQALGYVQKTRDSAVEAGRGKAESLVEQAKQKAMANPLGVALIGAGVAWHFYKKPPITKLLIGAGIATLMKGSSASGDGSDRLAYRAPYDRERPRGYGPGGVAGYGYPATESAGPGMGEQVRAAASRGSEMVREATATARDKAHEAASRVSDLAASTAATVSDTLNRAGTAISDTAQSTSAAVSETAGSARRTLADTAESAARSVSGTAESAARTISHSVESTARAISATAESASRSVSETADRIRTSASDMVGRTTSMVGETARGAMTRTRQTAAQAQKNPVLLGALGLAAGTALALALRGSDRGDPATPAPSARGRGGRTVPSSAARRRREMADATSEMASSAGEGFGNLAERAGNVGADVASTASDTVSAIGRAAGRALDAAGEAASAAGAGALRAASSAYRSTTDTAYEVGRRAPRTASWLGDEFAGLGTRYPLLLGALSLAIGAAVGGSMRPSERENRLMGPLSDRFRQRAWDTADEQFGRAKEAAGAVADHLRSQINPERPDTSADFETVIGGGKPGDGSAERATPTQGA